MHKLHFTYIFAVLYQFCVDIYCRSLSDYVHRYALDAFALCSFFNNRCSYWRLIMHCGVGHDGQREEHLRPWNYIGLDIYFNSLEQICIPTSRLSA